MEHLILEILSDQYLKGQALATTVVVGHVATNGRRAFQGVTIILSLETD